MSWEVFLFNWYQKINDIQKKELEGTKFVFFSERKTLFSLIADRSHFIDIKYICYMKFKAIGVFELKLKKKNNNTKHNMKSIKIFDCYSIHQQLVRVLFWMQIRTLLHFFETLKMIKYTYTDPAIDIIIIKMFIRCDIIETINGQNMSWHLSDCHNALWSFLLQWTVLWNIYCYHNAS